MAFRSNDNGVNGNHRWPRCLFTYEGIIMGKNIIGIDKDEGTLDKISRQLGMEVTKVHRGTKGTGITPQKVVKSSTKYTKTPIAKKTYTKQYDTKKKNDGLLGSITKYFK